MEVNGRYGEEMHLSLHDLIWNIGAIQFGWLIRIGIRADA